jgi:polysaccharide pyruvyl transferase CsaB
VRNKIAMCGWFGNGNIGDDVILVSELHTLNEYLRNCTIVVIGGNPNLIETKFGTNAIKYTDIVGLVKNLLKARVFILGGGGLIKPGSAWYYSLLLIISRVFGCKTVVSGVSAQIPNGYIERILLKIGLRLAQSITVRDHDSFNVVSSLGIKNVLETSDWAFLYPRENLKNLDIIKENYVVVALRQWEHEDVRGSRSSISYETYLDIMAKICDDVIKDHNLEILLVPFQTGVEECDMNDLLELRNRISHQNHVKVITTSSIDEVIEVIAKARLVIGMRLHSVILSSLTNTPFIAISYSAKVGSLVRKITGNNLINLSELTYEKMSRLLKISILEAESISNKLKQSSLEQREWASNNMKVILDFAE